MYVRWQRRTRKRHPRSPLLVAVLVESRRVDGEPRQRTLGYLAGISEQLVGEREREHREFWAKVDERLDELGLDPATRAKMEASIERRVVRVTPENQAEFDAATARIRREIAADLASIGIRPPGGV